MIRVLLADDHGLVREGLRGILSKGADIQVAAEAANGDEVLALVRKQDFDVVLLDLSMPGLSGIALIKRLKVEKPKLRILVLSMHGESQYAARALKAGASGYLTKDSAASQLLGAIRTRTGGVTSNSVLPPIATSLNVTPGWRGISKASAANELTIVPLEPVSRNAKMLNVSMPKNSKL